MAIDHSCAVTQNFCMARSPLPLDEFDHRLLALLQRDSAVAR